MLRATILLSSALAGLVSSLTSSGAEAPPPRWFKGNTHTHSLWSDGNDFPEMIADWYKKQGYHFLAISDHNVLQAREVWMSAATIAKRKLALGRSTMDKYVDRFGRPWVETREMEGRQEVRLKKLDEYRPLFEEPGRFLLIQAEEVTASYIIPPKAKVPVHINALNLHELITPVDGASIRQVLRNNLQAIREQEKRLGQPVLAHINHPNFQWALTAEDLAEAVEEDFFEIYNGHPKINYPGDATRVGHELLWDIANTLRISKLKAAPLYGLGTDDAHHYHGEESSPGRGWIMVRSPDLSSRALITAMRQGDFYASSGVTLDDVRFESGTLRIRVHAEPGVSYETRIVGTSKDFDQSTRDLASPSGDPHPIRTAYSTDIGRTFATMSGAEVSYSLTGKELYVRAVVTSSKAHPNPSYTGQHQMAWTQPVEWRGSSPK